MQRYIPDSLDFTQLMKIQSFFTIPNSPQTFNLQLKNPIGNRLLLSCGCRTLSAAKAAARERQVHIKQASSLRTPKPLKSPRYIDLSPPKSPQIPPFFQPASDTPASISKQMLNCSCIQPSTIYPGPPVAIFTNHIFFQWVKIPSPKPLSSPSRTN